MEPQAKPRRILRFGVFELDRQEAVLRKNGQVVRIQDQPLRVLAVLAERPRALVTREELRAEVWTEDEVVDFDRGLNTAINRLRQALGDSADSPTFIQTVPRRGYRFVAPVEEVLEPHSAVGGGSPSPAASGDPARSEAGGERHPERSREPRRTDAPTVHSKRLGAKALAVGALGLIAILPIVWLLRDHLGTAPARDRAMLAVLPLVDVSASPEPHLAQGLTAELIARLGSMAPDRLGVIARTTVMTYAGARATVERIGSELDVDFVLEGSVRRDADELGITVQLIAVEDQAQLWADSYQVPVADVLGAQLDVARRVVRQLAGEVVPGEVPETESVDPRAYDAYLEGLYLRDMLTEDGYREGIERFEEAVAYQPDFAPAYGAMAACYCLLSGHGLEVERPAVLMTKARGMAENALRLNPDLPIARGALGMAKLKYDWDWDGAEAEFVRALEGNANEPAIHIWYAFLLSSQGRHDEAIEHVETARGLDRFSRVANLNVAWQYYEARRYERALEEFDATLELHPGSWTAHWGRGLVHSERGDHDAARADLEVAVEDSGQHSAALGGWGLVLARAGDRAGAEDALAELSRRGATEYLSPGIAAGIHAALGDIDRAFEELERAYAQRSRSLVWLAVAHELDPLRADPRYDDLLRRMRLEDRR